MKYTNCCQIISDKILLTLERGGKKIYQSQVRFGGSKLFLLRAIVNDAVDPAVVVTVYRTGKIEKYWRQP